MTSAQATPAASRTLRPAPLRVLFFAARVALIYGLSCALWPALHSTYARAFRSSGNAVFGAWGETTSTRFQPNPRVGHSDVKVVLRSDKHPGAPGRVQMSSQRIGFFPTAFLVALIGATAGPRRRVWQLPLGLLLIHAFVVARVWLVIQLGFRTQFARPPALETFVPDTMLELLVLWTFDEITSSYLAALLVWGLVAFRAEDFARRVPAAATAVARSS